MGDLSRRHHTVPRFYLEGFSDGSRIGTVELPGDKRFEQSVRDATAMKNFYMLTTEDGNESDAFEKSLSEIEGEAARIVRSVTSDGVWPLPEGDRAILAEFAAVQYVRGPDQRRLMEQLAAVAAKLEISAGGRENVPAFADRHFGREVTEEQADRVWAQATARDGPPIRMSSHAHIQQIIKTVPEIYRYFLGRPWSLIEFKRKSLLTSDTPLALVPDASVPDQPAGLLNAWAITLPLSRTFGLLMGNPMPAIELGVGMDVVAAGTGDSQLSASTQLANLFNNATVANARRWVFHHPDDLDLVREDLPEPRTREMDTSGVDLFLNPDDQQTDQPG